MKLNILGTVYTVKECSVEEEQFLKNCDGYCDSTSKTICITKKKPEHTVDDFTVYRKKLLRHEIIHAFLYESGLHENFEHANKFGHDETTVDWFAFQWTKIHKVFEEAGAI